MTVASAYEQLRSSKPVDSARVPDFLLGLVLPLPIATPVPNLSLSVAMLGVAIGLASLRRAQPGDKMPFWAPVICVLMIAWMTLSLLYNGLSNYTQLAFFVMWVLSILAFASGRIDRVSVCRGLAVGLAVGCVAGLASRFFGIGGNSYPGRLTGYAWGDPNQAGYYLTVLTAVALVGLRPGWRRWLPLALFTICGSSRMSVGEAW
jgi:hypothetical protein